VPGLLKRCSLGVGYTKTAAASVHLVQAKVEGVVSDPGLIAAHVHYYRDQEPGMDACQAVDHCFPCIALFVSNIA